MHICVCLTLGVSLNRSRMTTRRTKTSWHPRPSAWSSNWHPHVSYSAPKQVKQINVDTWPETVRIYACLSDNGSDTSCLPICLHSQPRGGGIRKALRQISRLSARR